MIQAFQRWGQPKVIRLDNGAPLGDPKRKSIPPLALWLMGLGIKVIFNRPARPTDNAKVERMQQTTKNWAVVEQVQHFQQLLEVLDRTRHLQRQLYKVTRLAGRTRLEAFPELLDNPNKYRPDNFCIQRVYQHLAQWTFVRLVGKNGQFALYNQKYHIGTAWKKQYITVKFDPQQILWFVFDSNGLFLDALPAINLQKENILNLTVCQRTSLKKLRLYFASMC